MAYINGINIWVKNEKVNYNITTVSHPVETGIDITDHILKEPLELSITGKIVGENAADLLAKIRKIQEEGQLVSYEGRNRAENFQIVDFGTTQDYTITGGCDFDMTLRQVRVANGPTGSIEALQSFKNPIDDTFKDPEAKEEEEGKEGDEKKDGEQSKDGAVNTKDTTQAGQQQVKKNTTAQDIIHWIKKGETAYQITQNYISKGAVLQMIAEQIPGGPEYLEVGQSIRVATRL